MPENRDPVNSDSFAIPQSVSEDTIRALLNDMAISSGRDALSAGSPIEAATLARAVLAVDSSNAQAVELLSEIDRIQSRSARVGSFVAVQTWIGRAAALIGFVACAPITALIYASLLVRFWPRDVFECRPMPADSTRTRMRVFRTTDSSGNQTFWGSLLRSTTADRLPALIAAMRGNISYNKALSDSPALSRTVQQIANHWILTSTSASVMMLILPELRPPVSSYWLSVGLHNWAALLILGVFPLAAGVPLGWHAVRLLLEERREPTESGIRRILLQPQTVGAGIIGLVVLVFLMAAPFVDQ